MNFSAINRCNKGLFSELPAERYRWAVTFVSGDFLAQHYSVAIVSYMYIFHCAYGLYIISTVVCIDIWAHTSVSSFVLQLITFAACAICKR
jgi:hypothetical protein